MCPRHLVKEREGRTVSDRPEVIIPDWGLLIRGARLGHTGYCLGEGSESQLLQHSSCFPFLSPHHYCRSTTSPIFCQESFPPCFLQSTPKFSGLGPVCSECGTHPALLPPSCRLEAGSWCPTLSVTWFWLQKKPLDSGVLPLSLDSYLPHHLSFFPP